MDTEAVLFDLDGTLVDTLPLIIQTYKKVFTDLKIPWGNDDVVKWIGLPLVETARHFAGAHKKKFMDLYQYYYQIEHDRLTRLFPGTYETLRSLKARLFKLGVVTAKSRPVTLRTLAHTGLDRLMNVVITAHDVVKPKPDPEPVFRALAVLECAADRAIFIGDTRFDILAGKKAGACVLGVTWGLAGREELAPLAPDGLLEKWEDIELYLKRTAFSRQ